MHLQYQSHPDCSAVCDNFLSTSQKVLWRTEDTGTPSGARVLLLSLHLPESGEPKEHTQRQLWDQLAYMLGVLSLFDVWGWALISLHL